MPLNEISETTFNDIYRDYHRLLEAYKTFQSVLPANRTNSDGSTSMAAAHPGHHGRWTEEILVNLLRSTLPDSVGIKTGFVYSPDISKDTKTRKATGEIDIIVYDAMNYKPLLEYGNAALVSADSVIAMIAVTTTLTKAKLTSELENLSTAGSLCSFSDKPHPYKAVFGFKANASSNFKNSLDHLSEAFSTHHKSLEGRVQGISYGEIVNNAITFDGVILHSESSRHPFDKRSFPATVKGLMSAPPNPSEHYQTISMLIDGIYKAYELRFGNTPRPLSKLSKSNMKEVFAIKVKCSFRPERDSTA